MRTDFVRLNRANDNGQIQAEAWVVLEMHFLSRPHLIAEARERLAECLCELQAQGVFDPRSLKDQACRQIQLMYGPAPPLNEASPDMPSRRWVA